MKMSKASLHLIALLLLGLPFLAFADNVSIMKDVNVAKLVGKWYPVKAIKSDPNPVPLHAYTLESTADGGSVTTFEVPKDGVCTMKKLTESKSSPGVLTLLDGLATVMDTDYKTYLFTYLSNGKVRLLSFYARDKKVSKEVKEKFKGLVEKVGMKPAHHFKPQKEDFCTNPPA